MDLKDLKKLFKCDEDTITTPISFTLNGKCTNANLITKLVNFCVKKQMVLFKGKRMSLAQIGSFKDGYCTCCEEVIVTPGGSSNPNGSGSGGAGIGGSSTTSGSGGGAGIGGSLVEAWANAKLFPNQSNNGFLCGGVFSNVKAINFDGKLYFEAFSNQFVALNNVSIEVYYNGLVSPIIHSLGYWNSGLISFNGTPGYNVQNIQKIVIKASTYSTSNNPLCTSGSVTFTP